MNIAVVTNTIPNTRISRFSAMGHVPGDSAAQMGVVLSISRTSMIEKGSAWPGFFRFCSVPFSGKALLGVKAKAPAAWRAFNIGARFGKEFFYSNKNDARHVVLGEVVI